VPHLPSKPFVQTLEDSRAKFQKDAGRATYFDAARMRRSRIARAISAPSG
jgi:hypothetical protein